MDKILITIHIFKDLSFAGYVKKVTVYQRGKKPLTALQRGKIMAAKKLAEVLDYAPEVYVDGAGELEYNFVTRYGDDNPYKFDKDDHKIL